jgi:membrane protease YdiL (CAAX protease family)
MLAVGAGLYEELLFRVLLVGALVWLGRRVFHWKTPVAAAVAVGAGALLFSTFHYVGPGGDHFQLYSFVFRFLGGLFFSGLYVLRGFGITAWTHALYDVLVMVVRA